MNGYTYEIGQDQLCRNLAETLRGLDTVNANIKILSAANRSDGNPYEFERILRNAIHGTRVANDVMAALIESECTCTPLDGGLGATTCHACKRTAGTNQIEF